MMDRILEQKKDINGKTKPKTKPIEIQIKCGIQLIVMYGCWFLSCDKWQSKILTVEETGQGASGNSLYYYYDFSIKLKLS